MSLIMLALMSIVGIAGIRAVTGQERMVAQVFDRTVAFQAAEATLRQVEGNIETALLPSPTSAAGCAMMGVATPIMVCGTTTVVTPRWQDPSFTSWTSASKVGTSSFAVTPEYFVEYLGDNFPCRLDKMERFECLRYRVTVRVNANNERANVMLQSVYAAVRP